MMKWILLALALSVGTAQAQINRSYVDYSAAPAAAALTIVRTDTPAVQTTNASSYTFTAAAIGTASSDRSVIVLVSFGSQGTGRTISGVTIGGVSATLDRTNSSTSARGGQITARLLVTSGTTADVVVTLSGLAANCAIVVYSMTGSVSPTVGAPAGIAITSTDTTASVTASYAAGDAVIGQFTLVGAASTNSTTNLTKDVDQTVEVSTQSQVTAFDNFAVSGSSVSMSANFTAGNVGLWNVAVYSP